MTIDNFNVALDAFGRSIGLSDLVPDGGGYVALSFDDLPVHLQFDDEADAVVAFARIGEIDADRRETILAWLLGANLFWQGAKGATFAIEPQTDIVFIQNRMTMVQRDELGFSNWLGGFVDIADHWRKRLAEANAGQPLDDGEIPPDRGDDDETVHFHA